MTEIPQGGGEAFRLVLERLETQGLEPQVNGDQAYARCPSHDDQRPSLSVSDAADRVLIHCHADCDVSSVVEALDLQMNDLFNSGPPSSRRGGSNPDRLRAARPAKTIEYVYEDLEGNQLVKAVRKPPKNFHVEHWTEEGWKLGKGPNPIPLYRISDVQMAKWSGRTILELEGEKDVDRLWLEGFASTTVLFGASKKSWETTDTSLLDGADVVVIGDNDVKGREHAAVIVESLIGRAKRVRILDLEGMVPDKGDLSDWFDDGGTSDELNQLIESLPAIEGLVEPPKSPSRYAPAVPILAEGSRELYRVDDLLEWANRPLSWRVRGLLVEGTYTILGGAKKSLKTTLSAELAYAIANGVNWLDAPGFEVESPCPVVVLLNEGLRPYVRTLERISQRHDTEGIGPVHVIESQGAKWGDADTETLIRMAVEELDAGLLIYDAAYGFVDGDTEASNLFAMSDQLGLVQQLGKELGVDILIVHHLKKNLGRGKPDLDDLAWSGWAEWADSWLLLKHVTPPDVAAGHYNIGVVAGSRQWGEFTYEITGEFGAQTPDSIGPTKPPIWTVKQVNSEQAENWGKNYKKSRGGHEGILSIVEHHPFELTRSQLEVAVGGGKNTREAIRQMLKTEALISRYLPRKEGGGTKKRHLVGLPGHEPPET